MPARSVKCSLAVACGIGPRLERPWPGWARVSNLGRQSTKVAKYPIGSHLPYGAIDQEQPVRVNRIRAFRS